MKNRILSLFLVLLMLCSAMPVSANESSAIVGASFTQTELTLGTINAEVAVANTTDEITFTLGYYTSENILVKCASISLSVSEGEIGATTDISLDTPDVVSNGDYAKIIAYNKDTLQPYTISAGKTVIYCNKTRVDTYSGMNERYYTIDSASGSLSVTKRVVSVVEEGTAFRLKDMAEGYVAFEDITTPKYRLEYTESNGIRMWFCAAGNAKQLWKLEEYNNGYAIAHANGGYLAIVDNAIVVRDEKYEWSLNFYGETPFTLMTSLDGFKLLTDEEQNRVIEICTSIGADALPYATNNDSFLDDCEATFTQLYNGNYTAQQQKTMILAAVSRPVMGSLADSGFYYDMPTFPGGDAVITQKAPEKTTHEMWDLVEENAVIYSASEEHPYTGAPINCYRIDVTYTTADSTQNVAVYCVDPEFANVQTAISALGKFPYAYRQHIKNMYVYLSTTTSTYNCGGEELFVRLMGTANEQSMIKGFAHELGHSNDYMANGDVNNRASHWSQGAKWTEAVNDDIATISTYGNSNSDEGFAEFARLYWLCYGNRDLQIGIEQLYPNRFASFQRMLEKIGCDSEVIY